MRKASLLLLAAMVITLVACNNAPKEGEAEQTQTETTNKGEASEKEQIEKEKAALELERAALEKERAALEEEKAALEEEKAARNTAMEAQNQGPREVCVEMDVVITNESDVGNRNLVLKECSDDVHLDSELKTVFKNVYIPQGKRWRFKRVEAFTLEGPGGFYPLLSYAGKRYRTDRGNDGGIPDFTGGTKIQLSMGFHVIGAYQTHKSRCRIYFTEANDELAY